MSVREDIVVELSNHLQQAEEQHQSVEPPINLISDLTVKEAYFIQLHTIQNKLREGQKISGKKIGLTSLAMQQSLGVNEPDYGHLLDQMFFSNNSEISYKKVLQPRVEGEIAFILKKDLKGPNVTKDDVLLATEYIVPALEIVDSRITDWKISLADTIADNASSGMYVLGEQKYSPDQLELPSVKMDLYKNGEKINSGFGRDVLDHPAEAVAWLANKLSEFGITLNAGEVILSGAISSAISAEPGDSFQARFTDLGEVAVHFNNER